VKTKSIELGPGVTCPILRYHPAIIAQASATIDNLAPGRTYLAVGTGEALNEYSATGLWPDHDERQSMMLEAIQLIRALWSGAEVTFDGVYYSTKKARLYTPPVSKLPVYVSSIVPESAAFAGRYGDGLITVASDTDTLEQIVKNFEEGARDMGKDPSGMPRLLEVNVAYTEDFDSAARCFREYWAGAMVPALFNERIYTPAMSARNGSVIGNDILRQKSVSPVTLKCTLSSSGSSSTWASRTCTSIPRGPTSGTSSWAMAGTFFQGSGSSRRKSHCFDFF